jgi:hypothetical protein
MLRAARLEEEELHDQARAGVDLTYMMTNVPANASTPVAIGDVFLWQGSGTGLGALRAWVRKQALRGEVAGCS